MVSMRLAGKYIGRSRTNPGNSDEEPMTRSQGGIKRAGPGLVNITRPENHP